MGKKARPKLKIGVGIPGQGFSWKFVSKDDHPHGMMPPRFEPPTILTRKHVGDGFLMHVPWAWIAADAEEKLKVAATKLGSTVGYYQALSPDMFCRMIAKIAHTEAVGAGGPGAFIPFLPAIILGQDKQISKFVGGDPDISGGESPAVATSLTHQINLPGTPLHIHKHIPMTGERPRSHGKKACPCSAFAGPKLKQIAQHMIGIIFRLCIFPTHHRSWCAVPSPNSLQTRRPIITKSRSTSPKRATLGMNPHCSKPRLAKSRTLRSLELKIVTARTSMPSVGECRIASSSR